MTNLPHDDIFAEAGRPSVKSDPRASIGPR